MKRPMWLVLRIAISGTLIAYALSQADLSATIRQLPSLAWLPLAGMVLVNFTTRLVAAFRWYRLARTGLPSAEYPTFVGISLGSSFYGQFLPGGGVEALQVAGFLGTQKRIDIAVASILADRLFGLIALTILLGIGVLASKPELGETTTYVSIAALLGFWLLVAAALDPRVLGRGSRALGSLVGRTRVGTNLVKGSGYFEELARQRSRLVEALGLAVLLQLLRVAVYFLAALALGATLPIAALMLSIPAILLLLILPISIGGLGVRETALVFFFSLFGLAPELALGVALLIYACNIVVSLPGAWLGANLLGYRKAC